MGKGMPNEYIILNDNTAILRITSPKHGVFDVLIDINMIDKCKVCKWSVNRFKDNKYYGKEYFYFVNKDFGLLHRYITNAPKGTIVDHINGNTLDTRLKNLQICDRKINARKASISTNNKSGVIGVCWCNTNNIWKAAIKVDGKTINLGYFKTIDDARVARRKAEILYFGNNIPINNIEQIN